MPRPPGIHGRADFPSEKGRRQRSPKRKLRQLSFQWAYIERPIPSGSEIMASFWLDFVKIDALKNTSGIERVSNQ